MELTQRVMTRNPDRGPRRSETPRGSSVADPVRGAGGSGGGARSLRLVEVVDAELAAARVAPVKQRRRGLSAGALTVAIAEAQLAGADAA